MKTQNHFTQAWDTATEGKTLSPLLQAIGGLVAEVAGMESYRASRTIYAFSKRVATEGGYGKISALSYRSNFSGEWKVCNQDLELWARFQMWVFRLDGDSYDWAPIDEALKLKRLWQARVRYSGTGLTIEHCQLLQRLLWNMDTARGDVISLYVQGKRPFGNSAIEADIYEILGWPKDWSDDEGPTEQHKERAWNLFDELVFAAEDAARLAADRLQQLKGGRS